ncbi:hypothetical protein TNCV_4604641 [Trichonephila clavipes]|nr:hypothetical protein TNCV_4604641 [Trichonephila clavipes]
MSVACGQLLSCSVETYLLHTRRATNRPVFEAASCSKMFCVELGQNRMKTLEVLREVDGYRAMKQSQTFMRYNRFPERVRRPSTTTAGDARRHYKRMTRCKKCQVFDKSRRFKCSDDCIVWNSQNNRSSHFNGGWNLRMRKVCVKMESL